MRKHFRSTILVLVLLGLVAAGLAACGGAAGTTTAATYKNAGVAEAKALIENNRGNANFVILDVRTPAEYADGHLEGAVNVDLNSGSFNTEIAKQDKGKKYLVYCRTGARSASASGIMVGLGFTDVTNMTGGITDWTAAGYPTVK